MIWPSPTAAGTDSAETNRSGPIRTSQVAKLLVSVVSTRLSWASALAMRYQLPVAVLAGIVRAALALLLEPAGSAGTLRAPSAMSPASRMPLSERKYCVTLAGAAPPPWLRVVSVTVMLWPGPAVPGAANAETIRSGPICSTRAEVLLFSVVSDTALVASALAITYQLPVARPAGTVTVVDPVWLAPPASAGTLRL